MVNVIASKSDHTLYDIIRRLTKDIDLDINIIGLDDPSEGMMLQYYNTYPHFYEKPFFLYLEEYNTFRKPDVLQHPNFKGFISHIKDTCERLYQDYNSKTFYVPICSADQPQEDIKRNIESLNDRSVNLIAWSSWNDIHDYNFENRGGNLIDDLVMRLMEEGCDVRLTMRTRKNIRCKHKYPDRVTVVSNYIEKNEMDKIFSEGDIFLLPSRQTHSISLTYAMSFGMLSIVSDGWGISEFCNKLNSINIDDYDRIVKICTNKDMLKLQRKNTLALHRINYSDSIYASKFAELLQLGLGL